MKSSDFNTVNDIPAHCQRDENQEFGRTLIIYSNLGDYFCELSTVKKITALSMYASTFIKICE